jgi:hypothetical protein
MQLDKWARPIRIRQSQKYASRFSAVMFYRNKSAEKFSLKFSILFAIWLWTGEAIAQPSTNGLILWLDSSYSSSVATNSGNGVTNWLNLAPGATNSVIYTGANDNNTSASYNSSPPNLGPSIYGYDVITFSGNGYLENLNFSSETPASLTVFLLANTKTNLGGYSAFMSFRQSTTVNDYQTGLNVDQGQNPSTTFGRLNVEGAKAGGGGGFELITNTLSFGTFYVFQIDEGGGPANNNDVVSVLIDGTSEGSVVGVNNNIDLGNCYIGSRAYVIGGVPTANHDLIGQIAAVLVYDHQLSSNEISQTQTYLANFFAAPNLSITSRGLNSATVSWPNRGNFSLQQNTSLTPTNWIGCTNVVTTADGTNSININPALGQLFFRLTSP